MHDNVARTCTPSHGKCLDVNIVTHTVAFAINDLQIVSSNLQQPLVRPAVCKLEASLIDILAVHEVKSSVDSVNKSLLLGSGIAVPPRRGVLVGDAIDIAGDDGTLMVIGLSFEDGSDKIPNRGHCLDSSDPSTDNGAFFRDG